MSTEPSRLPRGAGSWAAAGRARDGRTAAAGWRAECGRRQDCMVVADTCIVGAARRSARRGAAERAAAAGAPPPVLAVRVARLGSSQPEYGCAEPGDVLCPSLLLGLWRVSDGEVAQRHAIGVSGPYRVDHTGRCIWRSCQTAIPHRPAAWSSWW